MKRFFITLLLSLLIPLTANAVVLRVVKSDSTTLVLSQGGGDFTIPLSVIRKGSDALKITDMTGRIVNFTQVRQLLTSLSTDDSDRSVNPGSTFGERLFWCSADGTPLSFGVPPELDTQLCSQADIIEAMLILDDDSYVFTIRNSQDCSVRPSFQACAP